ncbi:MAG TPA: hypothetical protein VF840_12435 [Terriglobales bacterium]
MIWRSRNQNQSQEPLCKPVARPMRIAAQQEIKSTEMTCSHGNQSIIIDIPIKKFMNEPEKQSGDPAIG